MYGGNGFYEYRSAHVSCTVLIFLCSECLIAVASSFYHRWLYCLYKEKHYARRVLSATPYIYNESYKIFFPQVPLVGLRFNCVFRFLEQVYFHDYSMYM